MFEDTLTIEQYLRYLNYRFLDGRSREVSKVLACDDSVSEVSEVVITKA